VPFRSRSNHFKIALPDALANCYLEVATSGPQTEFELVSLVKSVSSEPQIYRNRVSIQPPCCVASSDL
jgi:hypothetical protein